MGRWLLNLIKVDLLMLLVERIFEEFFTRLGFVKRRGLPKTVLLLLKSRVQNIHWSMDHWISLFFYPSRLLLHYCLCPPMIFIFLDLHFVRWTRCQRNRSFKVVYSFWGNLKFVNIIILLNSVCFTIGWMCHDSNYMIIAWVHTFLNESWGWYCFH